MSPIHRVRSGSAVLMCVLFAYQVVGAQIKASEPFTSVSSLTDATPTQTQRLDRIEHLPTTEAVHIFKLNPNAEIGERLKVSIPHDKTIFLTKTGGEVLGSGAFAWYGQVEGEERGSATIVSRNGEISGSINTTEGVYRITPLGEGAYAIVKINTRKFPPEEPSTKKE